MRKLQQQSLHLLHRWIIPFLLFNSFSTLFFFIRLFLTYQLNFSLLIFEIFVVFYSNSCPSFWLFFVLFGILRMLVTMNKLVMCNVSRITNNGTVFKQPSCSVSNKKGPILIICFLGKQLRKLVRDIFGSWSEKNHEKDKKRQKH